MFHLHKACCGAGLLSVVRTWGMMVVVVRVVEKMIRGGPD